MADRNTSSSANQISIPLLTIVFLTVQFQRLEKCHGILTAVISNLSENEAHDALNQMVGTQCYTGIFPTYLYPACFMKLE